MQKYKDIFPVLNQYTYLNTPAIGLLSQQVKNFRDYQNNGMFEKASLFRESNADLLPEIREKIANFLNGEAQRVALVPTFSVGLNAILEGIDPNAKVLLLEEDYPSINWAVEARDFIISYAAIDRDMENNIHQSFKESQPDVFVFSVVQYLNGIKMDLDFIRELKKEFPATLFIGDGTQFIGTEQFDFKNSGLDVIGVSGYKWLNAGTGNGFFMFQPQVEEKISPKYLGFGSIMGEYKEKGDTLIGKMEGNHLDLSIIGSIKVGMELQEKIGVAVIEEKIKLLRLKAKDVFMELDVLEDAVRYREQHSNIFNLKGGKRLLDKLTQNRIVCSQRGEGVRVGFHYYNTEEDIEKLRSVIEEK